jgi:DNA-binding beta-propeller fold protein YncE
LRAPRTALWIAAATSLAVLGLGPLGAGQVAAAPSPHLAPAVHTSKLAYGTIVVVDGGATSGSILEFAPGSHGNVAPAATITGSATGLNDPYGLALDKAGDIWVANFGADNVLEFASGAHGNVAPILTITGTAPLMDAPDGIALSSDGKGVWIGNDNAPTLAEYSTSVGGTAAPIRSIVGPSSGITWSHQVSVSPNGKHLWEADAGSGTLREFSTDAGPKQVPQRVITVGPESTHYVEGLAEDLAGHIWTSDNDTFDIYRYPATTNTPKRTLGGATTKLYSPFYLAFDATGKLWVANDGGVSAAASIEEFAPSAHKDVAPIDRIAGTKTLLTDSQGVEVFGGPPESPRSLKAHPGKHLVKLSWHKPSTTHGGLIGYIVRRRTTKHGAWTVVANVTHPKFTDKHLKKGHKYYFDVKAQNEFGQSAPTKSKAVLVVA